MGCRCCTPSKTLFHAGAVCGLRGAGPQQPARDCTHKQALRKPAQPKRYGVMSSAPRLRALDAGDSDGREAAALRGAQQQPLPDAHRARHHRAGDHAAHAGHLEALVHLRRPRLWARAGDMIGLGSGSYPTFAGYLRLLHRSSGCCAGRRARSASAPRAPIARAPNSVCSISTSANSNFVHLEQLQLANPAAASHWTSRRRAGARARLEVRRRGRLSVRSLHARRTRTACTSGPRALWRRRRRAGRWRVAGRRGARLRRAEPAARAAAAARSRGWPRQGVRSFSPGPGRLAAAAAACAAGAALAAARWGGRRRLAAGRAQAGRGRRGRGGGRAWGPWAAAARGRRSQRARERAPALQRRQRARLAAGAPRPRSRLRRRGRTGRPPRAMLPRSRGRHRRAALARRGLRGAGRAQAMRLACWP